MNKLEGDKSSLIVRTINDEETALHRIVGITDERAAELEQICIRAVKQATTFTSMMTVISKQDKPNA